MRTLLLAALLGCAACGNRPAPPRERGDHRIDPKPPSRVDTTGLTFPLDPPSLTALVAVRAFQKLSFPSPVFLTYAPDGTGRLFVVGQRGRIYVFPNDESVRDAEVFLDIREQVYLRHNEEGLLGLAFAPDYAKTGVFYVYYSASQPRRIVISRFRVSEDPNRADPRSEEVILQLEQPYGNHNGGMIAFGPDGYLYAGFGDGGAAGDPLRAGQDLSQLLAKIIRIAVTDSGGYSIPPGNPFAGTNGARPEVWAYGLRNPWRFSFDRRDGTLWAGDVGQDKLEEIDIIVRGGNYGWRAREGTAAFRGSASGKTIDPVIEYGRREGVSITGGYVYRGTHLPAFRGAYFYGDYGSGMVWALIHDGEKVISNELVAQVPSLTSFGEDADGELYALSRHGRIYRFEPTKDDDAAPAFPTLLSQTGLFVDTAKLDPNAGLLPYDVNVEFWSDGASKKRWLALPRGGKVEFANEGAWSFPLGTVVVKHFEFDKDTRLETRVMVHEQRGWAGYTYRWNEDHTDAELVGSPVTATYKTADGEQAWYFPAGSDCLRCHTESYGPLLGLRTRQIRSETLADWNARGVFDRDIGDATKYRSHPRLTDAAVPTEERARAYLDVNCAVCHHKEGPAPGSIDMGISVATRDMNLVGVAPEEGLGRPDELRLKPGVHRSSTLWSRMTKRGQTGMPPLSSNRIDEEGANLIAAWIDDLSSG